MILFVGVALVAGGIYLLWNGILATQADGVIVEEVCWFCHRANSVPHSKVNDWECENCGQYNGFSKDGSYARPVEAQHRHGAQPLLGNAGPSLPGNRRRPRWNVTDASVLCDYCAARRRLYVCAIAARNHPGEPAHEYEAWRRQADESYGLCSTCDQRVGDAIAYKDFLLEPELRKGIGATQ
eukprot:CAMPEP_0119141856 /NCGR_PEP_ID=MMETSP1310-20130426/31708_1 /TAXON_ID=464262 /ORGANISM="Genus nov. species nov., Strain RCC2339" /LENGTH=181 /DNA_ID=CAMNT_0007133343 /DNA_START=52 /DNA_END=594 /DNA_ORIENTATION=-